MLVSLRAFSIIVWYMNLKMSSCAHTSIVSQHAFTETVTSHYLQGLNQGQGSQLLPANRSVTRHYELVSPLECVESLALGDAKMSHDLSPGKPVTQVLRRNLLVDDEKLHNIR